MNRNRNNAGPRGLRRPLSAMPAMDCRAFTLLEVMIALAIMAIALTSLFGSQSQSLSLVVEAKFNVTAAFLAQEKLAEYESGVMELVDGEGDFGEDFPGFTWKTEVREADLGEIAGLEKLEDPVQRLDLTVSWEGDQFFTTLTYYGRERKTL